MNVYLIISSKYMYYVIFFYLFLADAKIIIWSQKESSSDFPKKKTKHAKTQLWPPYQETSKKIEMAISISVSLPYSLSSPPPHTGVFYRLNHNAAGVTRESRGEDVRMSGKRSIKKMLI